MTIGVILELEMGTIELAQLVSGVLAIVLLALILRRRKRRLELRESAARKRLLG